MVPRSVPLENFGWPRALSHVETIVPTKGSLVGTATVESRTYAPELASKTAFCAGVASKVDQPSLFPSAKSPMKTVRPGPPAVPTITAARATDVVKTLRIMEVPPLLCVVDQWRGRVAY